MPSLTMPSRKPLMSASLIEWILSLPSVIERADLSRDVPAGRAHSPNVVAAYINGQYA